MLLHPGLGSEGGGHPRVTTEEIDGGPFETFGFVDGRESEFGRRVRIVVGEELFEGLIEER